MFVTLSTQLCCRSMRLLQHLDNCERTNKYWTDSICFYVVRAWRTKSRSHILHSSQYDIISLSVITPGINSNKIFQSWFLCTHFSSHQHSFIVHNSKSFQSIHFFFLLNNVLASIRFQFNMHVALWAKECRPYRRWIRWRLIKLNMSFSTMQWCVK